MVVSCQVKSVQDVYLCCPVRFLKKEGILKRAKWFCSDKCQQEDFDLQEVEKMESET
jgi:hypothetical protein